MGGVNTLPPEKAVRALQIHHCLRLRKPRSLSFQILKSLPPEDRQLSTLVLNTTWGLSVPRLQTLFGVSRSVVYDDIRQMKIAILNSRKYQRMYTDLVDKIMLTARRYLPS